MTFLSNQTHLAQTQNTLVIIHSFHIDVTITETKLPKTPKTR